MLFITSVKNNRSRGKVFAQPLRAVLPDILALLLLSVGGGGCISSRTAANHENIGRVWDCVWRAVTHASDLIAVALPLQQQQLRTESRTHRRQHPECARLRTPVLHHIFQHD